MKTAKTLKYLLTLACLLAMALAFSAALPLSVTALAASDVTVALYATGVAHYKEENFSKLPAGVTASVDAPNKIVYLRLNNYNGESIFVQTPGKKWGVLVSVTGQNYLKVNKYIGTGKYSALGTNGGLMVYDSGGNASLTIDGSFSGTMVDADYYALYGDSIGVGDTSGGQLNLNINFNLVVSQYSNKDVYPVNEQLTINSASVAYHYASGQENPHPEEGIKLTGSAYFYVYYNAKSAKNRSARAFWGLEYDKNFTGVVYMNVINGYHYGGAYSFEKAECEMAPRYYTYIGDTEYYYVAAKNCQFPQNPLDNNVFGNALAFPVETGYTLPDRVSASGFDASVEWLDENGEDVTGKQAAYGVHYRAVVTPVPWGTVRIPTLTTEYLGTILHPYKPDNRYSYGIYHSGSKSYADGIILRYYIPVPDTVITKQPVNFDGSASDKNARFEVETSGPVSAYQWQTSDNGKDGWTNVIDKTIMSSTPITGAKTRSLNYNFVYEPSVTLRYFRCEITGSKNGAATKLYTNVVKFESADKISVVKISNNALPLHGQPVPTTASSSTPHVQVTGYACTMFDKKLDSFEAGDNVKITVQLEAVDGYVFDDEITGVLEGAEVVFCKVYDSKKTAVIDFGYRVGALAGGIPYESIKYYVDAPVVGEHPADFVYTYDPDAPFTGGAKQLYRREAPPVVSVLWYPEDDPFEGHKEYNLQFVVKSVDYENEGYTGYPYCFKKDVTTAYVNGEEAAIEPSADGKTATITYRFPLTADAIEVPKIEFTKLDYPDGETALDTVAESSTPGVTVDSVRYEKGGATVTEAAPGDELKVIFSFTLADGYLLAADANAIWNESECYAEYTGGTHKFLQIDSQSYFTAFKYVIPNDTAPTQEDNHTWNDGEITTPATCTKDGVKTYTCAACKATKTEPVKAIGHSYGAWTKLNDAQHQRVCTNDNTHTEKADHLWDEGKITTPSTCTRDGEKTYTCSVCRGTRTEAVSAKGHQFSSWTITRESTCAAVGELTRVCSICGTSETTEIAQKTEHSWDSGEITTPAKCTKDGITTYTCTVCKATKTEPVKAIGHNYGTWTKLNDAQHQRVCTNDKTHTEKADHQWDEGKITTPATCTKDGVKTYTCSVCSGTRTEAVKAGDHQFGVWNVTKNATCAAAGELTRTCSICGEKETMEIAKLNVHIWDEGKVTTPAACTKDGVKTYTCTVCKMTKTETIKATGHRYGDWKKLDGKQHQRVCANNSAHMEKAPHMWDAGKVTKQPDCANTGERVHTCAVCGTKKTETIPATGEHTLSGWTVVEPAGPGKAGKISRTCSVCGQTFYETLDPLPPANGKQKPGDVDGDGELTSADARLSLRASVGLEKDIVKGSAAYAAADADGDGEVTSGDARLILRASVGLEDASQFGKKA